MKDRFDLESEISFLHNFSDNLKSISEGILDDNLSKDDMANAIEGVRILIDLHADKLLDTLSQCFKLDGYKDIN
jgi:hypothetical protein